MPYTQQLSGSWPRAPLSPPAPRPHASPRPSIPRSAAKGLTDFKLVDTTFNSERGEREISLAMVDFLNKVGAVALAQHESELDNL